MSGIVSQHQSNAQRLASHPIPGRFGVSMSPLKSTFAPLLYSGRLTDGIDILPKYGLSAVEISLRQVSDLGDIQLLEKRLAENGLAISAFATGRMCLEDFLCLSDPHEQTREQLTIRLFKLIDLAEHFNAYIIIGGVRGRLIGTDQEQDMQRDTAIATMHRCAEKASMQGVEFLVEPINRYETNFINTAQQGLKFIQAVGQPNLHLLLDTFHMNIEEVDPCQAIYAAGDHLRYMHFADNNRHAPGQGHIDFPRIIRALRDVNYQGVITVEILPLPNDLQALADAAQFLHSLQHEKG